MLRAYYHDTRTTAESNTQLAVLEPLRRWNRSSELHETLTASLHAVSFYHKEFGCISDAPASAVFTNETIADGWYVLNPTIKLVEMAAGGDKWALALVLKSIDHLSSIPPPSNQRVSHRTNTENKRPTLRGGHCINRKYNRNSSPGE